MHCCEHHDIATHTVPMHICTCTGIQKKVCIVESDGFQLTAVWDWCCANIQIPYLIKVYITVANVIHAHPCWVVKELGEAHLRWQSAVWELYAQPSELDTSGWIEKSKKHTLITKHNLQTAITEQFSDQIESSWKTCWAQSFGYAQWISARRTLISM